MKTSVLKISSFICVCFLLFTATVVTSCKKDKKTYGTVTVKNASGTLISAAKVLLAAPSANGQKSSTGSTDGSGVAKFELPLPAIWDVTVTKDSLSGTGVLRLDEPGKHDDIVVIIR